MKLVTCAEIRDAFRAGDVLQGSRVEDHLRECEACAELFACEARLGRVLAEGPRSNSTAPSSPLLHGEWSAVESALRAEVGPRAWLRSRPTWQRLLLGFAPALVAFVVAGGAPRGDWAEYPVLAGALWLALFAGFAFSSLLLLLAPLGRPRLSAPLRVGLGAGALLLPLLYAAGLSEPVASGTGTEHGAELVAHALGCFTYGGAISLPFVAVVALLDRGERLAAVALLSLGGAGGLVANAGLLLHCAIDDPVHLVLGHATVGGVLVVALGAISALSLRLRR